MYTKDWLGLKGLYETKRIDFETCPGAHVSINKNSFHPYTYMNDSTLSC
jgi:hypothetical protein